MKMIVITSMTMALPLPHPCADHEGLARMPWKNGFS